MSDKHRAEFENWVKGSYVTDKSKYGEYLDVKTNLAWKAWQAAIASVVVELPRSFKDMYDQYVYDEQSVKQAIEDAGVKHNDE